MAVNYRKRLVGQHYHLEQVFPHIIEIDVIGIPLVLVHILPQTAVIPVTATDRNHRFVCRERVVVVYATASALESFRLLVAADVVVQRSHGILIYVVSIIVDCLLVKLVFRMLVQTTAKAQCH